MVRNLVASAILLAGAASAVPTWHKEPASSNSSWPKGANTPYGKPDFDDAAMGQLNGVPSGLEKIAALQAALAGKMNDQGRCDISDAKLRVDGLPEPNGKPGVIIVGRGSQNFTCSGVAPTEKPKAMGAVANLYDISCVLAADPTWILYRDVPKAALHLPAAPVDSRDPMELYDGALKLPLLGHHYFNDTRAASPVPVFDFHVSNDGFIAGDAAPGILKNVSAPATAVKGVDSRGDGSIPWIQVPKKFDAPGKAAFNELWRVETAAGAAPKTCGEHVNMDFTVEYAANYWYFN